VGDSGELDVEVYRRMRELFDKRVQEIWIRDVVNDEAVNNFRLKGVDTIIKAEKIVCMTEKHYERLSVIIQRHHQLSYAKNSLPPCSGLE
jgi:phosphatidate phosphatase APP1